MNTNKEAKLMSIVEFAQSVPISPDSIRRLIARGQLKTVRILRRILIPRSELDRLCAPKA
jgi:excisionase family DNA binding protein